MLVVRPSVINAQTYGGSASVAGFAVARPELAPLAEPMRIDVERFMLAGHGGVVRVVQAGGGLVVSGQVDEHGVHLRSEKEQVPCKEKVKVKQGNSEEESEVKRDCVRTRTHWEAVVAVRTQIATGQGQLLYLRPVEHRHSGVTSWHDGTSAPVPDAKLRDELNALRLDVARTIAWLVVPHKERVTATLYDCPKPATNTCKDGVRLLAASNYDGALNAYAHALVQLKATPKMKKSTLAEVHWNRAIVARYGRQFDLAVTELQAALALENAASYRRELDEVRAAAVDHVRLIDQGLGGSAP